LQVPCNLNSNNTMMLTRVIVFTTLTLSPLIEVATGMYIEKIEFNGDWTDDSASPRSHDGEPRLDATDVQVFTFNMEHMKEKYFTEQLSKLARESLETKTEGPAEVIGFALQESRPNQRSWGSNVSQMHPTKTQALATEVLLGVLNSFPGKRYRLVTGKSNVILQSQLAGDSKGTCMLIFSNLPKKEIQFKPQENLNPRMIHFGRLRKMGMGTDEGANKGAVFVKLTIREIHVVFVSVHFDAHHRKYAMENINKVGQTLASCYGDCLKFWMGDFNPRIAHPLFFDRCPDKPVNQLKHVPELKCKKSTERRIEYATMIISILRDPEVVLDEQFLKNAHNLYNICMGTGTKHSRYAARILELFIDTANEFINRICYPQYRVKENDLCILRIGSTEHKAHVIQNDAADESFLIAVDNDIDGAWFRFPYEHFWGQMVVPDYDVNAEKSSYWSEDQEVQLFFSAELLDFDDYEFTMTWNQYVTHRTCYLAEAMRAFQFEEASDPDFYCTYKMSKVRAIDTYACLQHPKCSDPKKGQMVEVENEIEVLKLLHGLRVEDPWNSKFHLPAPCDRVFYKPNDSGTYKCTLVPGSYKSYDLIIRSDHRSVGARFEIRRERKRRGAIKNPAKHEAITKKMTAEYYARDRTRRHTAYYRARPTMTFPTLTRKAKKTRKHVGGVTPGGAFTPGGVTPGETRNGEPKKREKREGPLVVTRRLLSTEQAITSNSV